MTLSAGPALKRLHEQFGDAVPFLTLYVREAHPGERYPQPEDAETKLRHARDYRDRDRLPWPVLVDDLEGDLHQRLDPKPNAVYLVDRHGRVVFRTLWANERESALREALEALAAGREGAIAERSPRLLPMLRGSGVSRQAWEQAGEVAKRDVFREAPPMYLTASLAALFRPLPPAGRALAANALLMLPIAAVAALTLRRSRRG